MFLVFEIMLGPEIPRLPGAMLPGMWVKSFVT